jgi:hypothetical protein
MPNITFSDTAIVSCGTLSLELNHLKKTGFLDTRHLFFTTPGLHEDIPRLERHLVQQIACARDYADKVIVVYGGKFCYVNVDDPTRTMQTILAEQGPGIAKIEATHCMDMIAGEEQRDEIALQVAGGQRVWWMTPGWIQFRHNVFKDWDRAMANENFPRHNGGAVVLDGIGFMDDYMEKKPEAFLDYADWMGIPIQPVSVSLERFKSLLADAARKLSDGL